MRLLKFLGILGYMALAPIGSAAQDTAQLSLAVDSRNFFINNEYFGEHIEGYTLPGFTLTPKLTWNIHDNVMLETGAHWLHFWGQDTTWNFLPWARAKVEFRKTGYNMTLVIGNLINDGHMLTNALYDYERCIVHKPEAGIQLIYNSDNVGCNNIYNAEAWVDWSDFIYPNSLTQEHFTAGLAANAALYLGKRYYLTIPLYFVGQHRGGQILKERMDIQNHFNFAAGLGIRHDCDNIRISVECLVAGYSQKNDTLQLFDHGLAMNPRISLSWRERLDVSAEYWHGEDFVPLLGSPIYSNASGVRKNLFFEQTDILSLYCRYTIMRNKHCNVSVRGTVFQYLGPKPQTQFSAGCIVGLSPKVTLIK